jgi:hypothetical protein
MTIKNNNYSYKQLRLQYIISISGLISVLLSYKLFLFPFIRNRDAIQFSDIILASFSPLDISPFIIFMTYSSILIGICFLLHNPERLLQGIQACGLLYLFRMLTIILLPLQAPIATIPLNDVVAYGDSLVSNDLFFSGHTAVTFLLILFAEKLWQKKLLFICFICIIMALIIQHQHYTIDIITAPFFSFSFYRFILWVHKRQAIIKE